MAWKQGRMICRQVRYLQPRPSGSELAVNGRSWDPWIGEEG